MGITGLLPLLKDITRDVHVRSFSGKVAAIDAYCWIHKAAIFCAEEIILGIETMRYVSTLRSYTCLKCMILNVSFSLVLLFTSDFIFSGTLTCAWSILICSSKIMCSLFWFSMEWSWRPRQKNVETFQRRWGQHEVSGGFLVVLVRINSGLSVPYCLYELLGIVKNLGTKV